MQLPDYYYLNTTRKKIVINVCIADLGTTDLIYKILHLMKCFILQGLLTFGSFILVSLIVNIVYTFEIFHFGVEVVIDSHKSSPSERE